MVGKPGARRKANGEGTILKQPNGTYRAWSPIRDAKGKRPTESGFKYKKDAQAWIDEIKAQRKKGILPASGEYTVGAWMHQFLIGVKANKAPATAKSYSQLYRLYLEPALSDLKLIELQVSHLDGIFSEMRARGLSLNTIQRTRAVIRRALNNAKEQEEVHRNVANLCKVASPKRNRDIHPLTIPQAKALIAQAEGTQYDALYTLAVYCGLRQGELLALTWGCIDWEKKTLTVRQQAAYLDADSNRKGVATKLKTDASHRTFTLPAPCFPVLKERQLEQKKQRVAASSWEDNDLIFSTGNGKLLGARNVVRRFKQDLKAAGLPDIPFHMLRHGTATYLAVAGVPQRTAMEILGHSQLTTLVHAYQHAPDDMRRDAADRLSAMFA